jgi:hypothetical protein
LNKCFGVSDWENLKKVVTSFSMKCSVTWCSDKGDPYFGGRCTEHALEWLATLSPADRDKALGPTIGFPKVLRPQDADRSGKFIFLEIP